MRRPGISWHTLDNPPERPERFPQPIKIGPALLRSADHLDAWHAVHPAG